MATSTKGAGTLLGPLAITTLVVVGAMVLTFSLGGDEPPSEPTIIAEDVAADPAGAGTNPQGEADLEEEGITDEIDEVDPAAPGTDTVPPAETGMGGGSEGGSDTPQPAESGGQENVLDTPSGENTDGGNDGLVTPGDQTQTGSVGAGGADGVPSPSDSSASSGDQPQGAQDEFLLDEETTDGQPADVTQEEEGAPAGRDTEAPTTPEPGQDVVEDTDDGGTPFVPTPSGPTGRDGETVAQ